MHQRKTLRAPLKYLSSGTDLWVFESQAGEWIRYSRLDSTSSSRRYEGVTGLANPLIKAHVFLCVAKMSAVEQSQIVSAASSRCENEPLRDAMLAAPRV